MLTPASWNIRQVQAGLPLMRIALISLLAASAVRAGSADGPLAARLDPILAPRPGKSAAAYAGLVVELPSGRVLYSSDADRPLMPASVAKMVVIAASLERFGPDFPFETILARRGDDLVVIGGGDPAFGDPRLAEQRKTTITATFRRWADALKSAGATRFRGRLVYDDSIFEPRFVHPGWPADQYETWYEAPIGGLNLADNCVTIVAAVQKGGATSLSMTPANTALKLIDQTRRGRASRAVAKRARDSDQIVVTGTIAESGKLAELTVPDPGLYFASALKTSLAAAGVAVEGGLVRQRIRLADGSLPRDLAVIARERTPLRDVAARAGKQSLGMMAEGLFKRLGAAETGGTGSWQSGARAVEKFMLDCGASPGQFHFDDGCGLSRENRLSPAAAVSVLRRMFASRHRDAFMSSLAHCGDDGTLERRMRDIKGRVIAKTGYISGVRTLAGYIRTQDDRWLAFAFMHNHASNTSAISAAEDQACRILSGATPTTRPRRKPAT